MSSLVKMARLSYAFSIEEAEAARMLNISAGYLSQIENGQRQVSAARAEEIAILYQKKEKKFFCQVATRYAKSMSLPQLKRYGVAVRFN